MWGVYGLGTRLQSLEPLSQASKCTIKLTQKEGGGEPWEKNESWDSVVHWGALDAYCFGVFEKYYSLIRRKNGSPLKGLIDMQALSPRSYPCFYLWMEWEQGWSFITECWFSVTHYTLCHIACRMVQPAKIQHYELLSSQLWVVWLRGTSLNRDHYLLWIPGWWNRKLICIWRSWIIVLFHLPSMCCYSNRSAALQEHEVFLKPWKGREGVQLHSFKC